LRFTRIKMASFYGGNRYQEPAFQREVASFVEKLQALLPTLRAHQVRLLIENHQDLGAEDLLQIIRATSADWIGINWDMGNSLAVLDTPETFLKKAGSVIGNVHLKDYRLFRCEEGFYLTRCALGDGVVDFAPLLKALRRQHGLLPMAIELGAQQARRADVFQRAYWEAYPPSPVTESLEFFAFLTRHLRVGQDGEWNSPWERRLSGPAIVESEMKELERSVAFLKGLEV